MTTGASQVSEPLSKGAQVFAWYDTGAYGSKQIVGTVVSAGPRAATIEWESGIRNRLPWQRVYDLCFHYSGEFEN